KPASRSVQILPPGRDAASRTVTAACGARRCARANPEIPPPTMTTRRMSAMLSRRTASGSVRLAEQAHVVLADDQAGLLAGRVGAEGINAKLAGRRLDHVQGRLPLGDAARRHHEV